MGAETHIRTSSRFAGEPSYSLIIRSDDPQVDAGCDFNFDVFISGAGNVDAAKLYIFIPEYLAKNRGKTPEGKNAKVLITNHNPELKEDLQDTNLKWMGLIKSDTHEASSVNCIELSSMIFSPIMHKEENGAIREQLVNFGEIIGVSKGKNISPFSFTITIDKQAPPGDHDIIFNLVYRDAVARNTSKLDSITYVGSTLVLGSNFNDERRKWHSEKSTLKVHVKKWYEKDWVKYVLILPVLSALKAFIDLLGLKVPDYSIDTTIKYIVITIAAITLLILIKINNIEPAEKDVEFRLMP
jgi:hypothetical protein